MRKLIITMIGTLLISTNASATIDAKALANIILHTTSSSTASTPHKDTLTIVYGGQDISRSDFSSYKARFDHPVMVA